MVDVGQGEETIRTLAWDSGRFGIRVGRIVASDQLEAQLEAAAADFDLVYVHCDAGTRLDEGILDRFGGALTDERVRFERPVVEPLPECRADVEGEIRSVAPGEASDALLELGVQAAEFSRFRSDPHFPSAWTEDLYRSWIQNAIERTHGDEVLGFFAGDRLLGVYTLRVIDGTGNLDLFAVDANHRGCGIGAALLAAGLRYMADHAIMRASVTSQRRNPACRLYLASGYSLAHSEAIYHLWPRRGERK